MRRSDPSVAVPLSRATSLLVFALVPAMLGACGVAREVERTSSRGACTGCHGDPARAGDPPIQAAPPSRDGVADAHPAHLRTGVACGACHVVPTTVGHSNRTVDVTFDGLARANGARPAFSTANGTCSGVYCHRPSASAGGSVAAPTWTDGKLPCDACHGRPPPSHEATDTACAACHPGTMRPDGTIDVAGGWHVDGTVEWSGGHRAGWGDPARHGPAAKGDLANCRTCHGQRLDGAGGTAESCDACHAGNGYPDWQFNCTFCHGSKVASYTAASLTHAAPPRGNRGETATSAVAVGAHQRHLAGGTLGAGVACDECHTVPGSLSHLDGTARVTFGATATKDGAVPAWNGTTCASTYCHGGSLSGGFFTAPAWTGGSAQTTCGSCHGIPPPSPHASSSACGSCHRDYTATTVSPALHMNGVVDSNGNHPAGWVAKDQHGFAANRQGLSACAACHGTDFAGGTAGVGCNDCHARSGWAAWQTNCTFCHGSRVATYASADLGSAAPPSGTEGETAATARAVGAHQRHLAGGSIGPAVACSTCHAVPTDLAHVTGTPVVTLSGPGSLGGVRASWNGTTCTTYCHGASLGGGSVSAPSWTGGSGQAACGACHRLPPTGHAAPSTDCSRCHDGYTASAVNPSLHLNGKADATGGHEAGWLAKEKHGHEVNRQGLSSCKGCHGSNLDGVGGSAQSCATCHASAGFANWSIRCTFCHGNRSNGGAAPPVDTQGGSSTGGVSVGAHAAHLGTSLMNGMACTVCHPDRSGSNVVSDPAHIDGNGVAEVVLAGVARTGGANATYSRGSATSASCASVYCHGKFNGGANGNNGATMSWTSTANVSCTSCHGLPPLTSRHAKHLEEGVGCGECHAGYTAWSVNRATHIDGKILFSKTCTSCHGSEGDD